MRRDLLWIWEQRPHKLLWGVEMGEKGLLKDLGRIPTPREESQQWMYRDILQSLMIYDAVGCSQGCVTADRLRAGSCLRTAFGEVKFFILWDENVMEQQSGAIQSWGEKIFLPTEIIKAGIPFWMFPHSEMSDFLGGNKWFFLFFSFSVC